MAEDLAMMIGKAKIQFRAVGCAQCGTEHAPAWVEAEKIKITIGNRREYITLYKCAQCAGLGDRMLRASTTSSASHSQFAQQRAA